MRIRSMLPDPPLQKCPRVMICFIEREKESRKTIGSIDVQVALDGQLHVTTVAVAWPHTQPAANRRTALVVYVQTQPAVFVLRPLRSVDLCDAFSRAMRYIQNFYRHSSLSL